MSDRLYTCGHCEKDFLVTGYAAHVKSCVNKAVAIQSSRRPPRFPKTWIASSAINIPITLGVRQKALEESA